MADRNEGCVIATGGCAIAVVAVGLGAWSVLGQINEGYGEVRARLLAAAVGVIFGVIVFIVGIAGIGADGGGGGGAIYVSSNRCRRCGSRQRGDPKTCRVCGLEEPLRK